METKIMVQRLGDGQCICDKCWAVEYTDRPEPENNWELGSCDFCFEFVARNCIGDTEL